MSAWDHAIRWMRSDRAAAKWEPRRPSCQHHGCQDLVVVCACSWRQWINKRRTISRCIERQVCLEHGDAFAAKYDLELKGCPTCLGDAPHPHVCPDCGLMNEPPKEITA